MTDTATIAPADKDAPIQDTPPYDEDLLVQLLVEGTLSYRKIADRVGASRTTVSNISRGRSRPDLYERICQLVEDTHRRTRRRAAASIEAVYEKYLAIALESEGETARKACEFILKTFANTPDPAGRYIGLQAQGSPSLGSSRRALTSPVTQQELDLIAAVRNDANAPAFDDLAKPVQDRLNTLVATQNPAGSDPGTSSRISRYPDMAAVKRDQAAITAGLKFLENAPNRTFTPPIHPDDLANPIEFDWTAPPRTDYETDLPETEAALRLELAGLRRNACIIYEEEADYLGEHHDALITAGLDHDQARRAAARSIDASWLVSLETLAGREAALIRKLAQLRLDDKTLDTRLAAITAKQTNNTDETDATPSQNPQSEIHNPQLDALRQLERTHLAAFAPAPLDTDADSSASGRQ